MATQRVNISAFEDLGQWIDPPPPPPPIAGGRKKWRPRLTPTQQRLMDCTTRNILAWSEKFSGKTYACLMKLVRHCYDNKNALAVIVVKEKSMATKGGAWDKLQTEILPEWKKGLGLAFS